MRPSLRARIFQIGIAAACALALGTVVGAQNNPDEQAALRNAKANALAAEQRSEILRQEASNASRAADRLVAQRAVLSAEIDAATAQIAAANARIAIINRRQREQRSNLGEASEPMLRLNAALQQMTQRPAALIMVQPGQRRDYVHLRAVMASVEPQILRRTAALRQQIAIQKELRGQEQLALKSLGDAKGKLAARREALARLADSSRGRADGLSADAAAEFEQAIAQGERARDIVERIDTLRSSGERAAALAALSAPPMRRDPDSEPAARGRAAYLLPVRSTLLSGFNELNSTGYRERGIRLLLSPGTAILAPATGKVIYAGNYRSYGKIVIIEHGSGWTSLITNFGELSVNKGAAVGQGALLGRVLPDNPEISIELRRNGRTMDIAALTG